MEGPVSVICLRTCYIKDPKMVCFAENPSELRQSHPSRNGSHSRRTMRQRQSNSISLCTLPIIPEYPGFQDIKLSRNYLETPACNPLFQDLEREKSSSSQLDRTSSVHGLEGSPRGYLKGHPTTSSCFHDKPLQEYFNERLMELRNYESKRSNRKTKGFADKNQKPFLTRRGSRRRSSAGVVTGLGKESRASCSSANQDNKKAIEYNDEEETQNVLGPYQNVLVPYKADFLDILTMHISAPLEAFVQKKCS